MTNDTELKPCPCGKIPPNPESLHIIGADAKWKWVSAPCCAEWSIEFRTQYHEEGSPEIIALALDAWNEATRNTRPKPSAPPVVTDGMVGVPRYPITLTEKMRQVGRRALLNNEHQQDWRYTAEAVYIAMYDEMIAAAPTQDSPSVMVDREDLQLLYECATAFDRGLYSSTVMARIEALLQQQTEGEESHE